MKSMECSQRRQPTKMNYDHTAVSKLLSFFRSRPSVSITRGRTGPISSSGGGLEFIPVLSHSSPSPDCRRPETASCSVYLDGAATVTPAPRDACRDAAQTPSRVTPEHGSSVTAGSGRRLSQAGASRGPLKSRWLLLGRGHQWTVSDGRKPALQLHSTPDHAVLSGSVMYPVTSVMRSLDVLRSCVGAVRRSCAGCVGSSGLLGRCQHGVTCEGGFYPLECLQE